MERYCHRIGTEPPSGSGYEHLEISLLFWFGTTVISWKYFAEIFPFCSQNECPCSVVDVRWRKTVLILWHLYRASELWIKSSKTTGTELTHWQLTSQRHFNNLLLPANPTPVLSGRYDVSISSAEVLDPPWPARRFVWMLLQSAEWHYPVNVCNAESKYNRARYALPIPHPFAEALRWRWMTSLRASPFRAQIERGVTEPLRLEGRSQPLSRDPSLCCVSLAELSIGFYWVPLPFSSHRKVSHVFTLLPALKNSLCELNANQCIYKYIYIYSYI